MFEPIYVTPADIERVIRDLLEKRIPQAKGDYILVEAAVTNAVRDLWDLVCTAYSEGLGGEPESVED